MCLSPPDASEVRSWGHPNFRTKKRIFVTFEWVKGRPSIAFRLNATDVDLLLRRTGFFATPYGQRKWASVWTDESPDWRLIARLVKRSYRAAGGSRERRKTDLERKKRR